MLAKETDFGSLLIWHTGYVTQPLEVTLGDLLSHRFRASERCLSSPEVTCCVHCCLLDMPRMLRIHLWWNELSLLRSLLRGVQHSDPYNKTERMQAWYTARFVSTLRSLFPNAALRSAPKALEAWATLSSKSSSTLPDDVITDPR